MGREADDPLPDFSVFPPIIGEFESPPGTYYDAWPLLVMTRGALRRFNRRCPIGPSTSSGPALLVIGTDDGCGGHPEFGSIGRPAMIGTVMIDLPRPVPALRDGDPRDRRHDPCRRPRGAMLSHRALLANIEQVGSVQPPMITADDVVLGVLPLFHVYGLNAVLGVVTCASAPGWCSASASSRPAPST